MRRIKHYCWISLLALQSFLSPIHVEGKDANTQVSSSSNPFAPFTGRITKNKVRMRLQPNFESTIIKELNRDDLLVIVDENDEFYAVQPPPGTKAYVFRTYILDNVVEGSRVNVRLEPNTDAPIISQLNSGDKVQGTVSPINSKWLEIAPPISTRFYVAKEYVEKVGDTSVMATMMRRKEEVNKLLNDTSSMASQELNKTYDQMNGEAVIAFYQTIIRDYSDFTEQASKARELLTAFEDNYLRKKIAYLESKNKTLHQEAIAVSNKKTVSEPAATPPPKPVIENPYEVTTKMAAWLPSENAIYATWASKQNNKNLADFYDSQRHEAVTLQGVVEPYYSSVKNKPGDYVLINQASHLPVAYLYSTKINLEAYVGKEVSVVGSSRPNRYFAFPAYFVLGMQ